MGAVTGGLDRFRESQILLRRVRGGHPRFHPHSDCRKRHSALKQTAGKQSFTRLCPARLDISWCSACVYRDVTTDVLLQTPAVQE